MCFAIPCFYLSCLVALTTGAPVNRCPSSVATFPRQCPQLDVVEDFDLDRYLGRWFEWQKYPNDFQVQRGIKIDCVFAQYDKDPNRDDYIVVNNVGRLGDNVTVFTGEGRRNPSYATDGKLQVRFPRPSFLPGPPSPVPWGDYWVLDTDYVTYSVVWSCETRGTDLEELLWILGREPVMDKDKLEDINSFLQEARLNVTRLVPTNQDENECEFVRLSSF